MEMFRMNSIMRNLCGLQTPVDTPQGELYYFDT